MIIAVLAGYVVLQSVLFSDQQSSVIGLSGQATQLADPLREKAKAFGIEVETLDVTTDEKAEQRVREGSLDALVTGAPRELKMIVKGSGDEVLTAALNRGAASGAGGPAGRVRRDPAQVAERAQRQRGDTAGAD